MANNITDLTGTTWTINSVTCSAGYGQFNITGSVYDENNNIPTFGSEVAFIYIGYAFQIPGFNLVSTANRVLYNSGPGYVDVGYTITITGGTDATHPDLIDWLQSNATQVQTGHTVTIDGTDYTIDDNTNLLVNSTGLYNSTTSTQVWTYSGDTKFLGFATSSGGAIVYDINDTITLTADLTLYSVEQARMPLYINNVRTDKYHNKVINKIGDYFVARYEYSITTTVTNGTYSGSTSILDGGTATVTVTAGSGYELPSSITVSGASYSYNNGVISLSNPTGDVTISVVCESAGYSVTFNFSYTDGPACAAIYGDFAMTSIIHTFNNGTPYSSLTEAVSLPAGTYYLYSGNYIKYKTESATGGNSISQYGTSGWSITIVGDGTISVEVSRWD